MLVPIADLKASIELFHREVIVTNPHFRNTSCSCCQDCETCPQGVHLPHLALPVQAASPPRHAQAPHQQGEILKHRTKVTKIKVSRVVSLQDLTKLRNSTQEYKV